MHAPSTIMKDPLLALVRRLKRRSKEDRREIREIKRQLEELREDRRGAMEIAHSLSVRVDYMEHQVEGGRRQSRADDDEDTDDDFLSADTAPLSGHVALSADTVEDDEVWHDISKERAIELANEVAKSAVFTRDGAVECGVCGARFRSAASGSKGRGAMLRNLQKHCFNHSGTRVLCLICGMHMTRHDEMQRHVRNMHAADPRVRKFPDGTITTDAANANLVIQARTTRR